MKLLTLDDYKKAGDTFWEKYWYVAKELGGDAKTEDIPMLNEHVSHPLLEVSTLCFRTLWFHLGILSSSAS